MFNQRLPALNNPHDLTFLNDQRSLWNQPSEDLAGARSSRFCYRTAQNRPTPFPLFVHPQMPTEWFNYPWLRSRIRPLGQHIAGHKSESITLGLGAPRGPAPIPKPLTDNTGWAVCFMNTCGFQAQTFQHHFRLPCCHLNTKQLNIKEMSKEENAQLLPAVLSSLLFFSSHLCVHVSPLISHLHICFSDFLTCSTPATQTSSCLGLSLFSLQPP